MKFKYTQKKITDAVNRIKKDSKKMTSLGNAVLKNIKADSLNGHSFNGKSFPSLKSTTIKYRKYLAKYNQTSPDYSASTSNVTIIGDLIKNLKVYLEKGKIVIEARGKHKAYKGKNGTHKHRATYSTILNALYKLNRKILGLSNKSKEKILLEVKREIKRSLK